MNVFERPLALVAIREVRERTRSKTYRIGLVLTALIALVAIVGPALAAKSTSAPTATRIGVVGESFPVIRDTIRSSYTSELEPIVLPLTDRAMAESQLRQNELDIAVISGSAVLVRNSTPHGTPQPVELLDSVRNIATLDATRTHLGITDSQTQAIANAAPLPVQAVIPPKPIDLEGAMGSTQGMIVLFVFLTLFGAFILNGVIEEKNSRVVEILLSTIDAKTLLTGRIIGISLVGLIQGLVIVATAMVARVAVNAGDSVPLSPRVLAITLLWTGLGFAIYSWLYACAGAMASRSEDAQNLVFPLQIPLIGSYAVGMIASTGVNIDTVLVPMSLFPLTAPMTMVARMSAGIVPGWQIVVSILLCIGTALLIRKLALIIFTGSILRAGKRVKLREAWVNSR